MVISESLAIQRIRVIKYVSRTEICIVLSNGLHFCYKMHYKCPNKKFKVNVEGSIDQWSPYNPFMSRTPNRVKIEKVIAEAPEHLQEVLSLLQLSSVHMHALAVVV